MLISDEKLMILAELKHGLLKFLKTLANNKIPVVKYKPWNSLIFFSSKIFLAINAFLCLLLLIWFSSRNCKSIFDGKSENFSKEFMNEYGNILFPVHFDIMFFYIWRNYINFSVEVLPIQILILMLIFVAHIYIY